MKESLTMIGGESANGYRSGTPMLRLMELIAKVNAANQPREISVTRIKIDSDAELIRLRVARMHRKPEGARRL